jgi:hypothetical protein
VGCCRRRDGSNQQHGNGPFSNFNLHIRKKNGSSKHFNQLVVVCNQIFM